MHARFEQSKFFYLFIKKKLMLFVGCWKTLLIYGYYSAPITSWMFHVCSTSKNHHICNLIYNFHGIQFRFVRFVFLLSNQTRIKNCKTNVHINGTTYVCIIYQFLHTVFNKHCSSSDRIRKRVLYSTLSGRQ